MKRKLFSILLTLVLLLSFSMVTAVPVAADPDPAAPQMEEISGLGVITGDTWDVSTGTVELVFDFYDAEDDLVELEIDFSPDPYDQPGKEQVAFKAIEGGTNPDEELALLAIMGIVPSYDASEQKWTISIDTTAIQTQELINIATDLGRAPWFPWAQNVGDAIFPDGLFHWYLEVVDEQGNLWGDMMAPPAYSHYICYFHTIQSAIDGTYTDPGDTINVAAGTYNEGLIVIDKELTIVGDPLDKPVINPTEDTGSNLWVSGPTGRGWFQITGGPVEFENLVFDGNGKAIWIAIHYHVGGLGGTVKNCDFKNIQYSQHRGRGISNYGGYVEVLDSTFTNIERIGVFTGEVGAESLIKGCTYTGKGAGDWLDYGFETGAGAHATIEDNTVTDCYGEGSGWGSAGIYVHEAFGPGTSATITGNTISGSNYGIVVGYAYVEDTSVVVANYNNIAGNDYGVKSTGPQVDATLNWWGHASGPSGEDGRTSNSKKGKVIVIGKGDAVSANVDWDHWLPQPVNHTPHHPVPPGWDLIRK